MAGPDKWVDRTETAEFETLNEIIETAFVKAVAKLERHVAEKGLDDWQWGGIHTFRLDHPMGSVKILDRLFGLNSEPRPIGGSYHTVSPYSYGSNFVVNNGASQRHIYNTADWDASWSIIPTGNSGVPGTPFYLSQTDTYLAGGIYRDHFSEGAVKDNARHTLKLSPLK